MPLPVLAPGRSKHRIHGLRGVRLTSSAFPTLVARGYTTAPAALIGVAATVDGPSGANDWEVDIVNNSGLSVSFTEFTVCTT